MLWHRDIEWRFWKQKNNQAIVTKISNQKQNYFILSFDDKWYNKVRTLIYCQCAIEVNEW